MRRTTMLWEVFVRRLKRRVTREQAGKLDRKELTQVGRALSQLGITQTSLD